eukprot:4082827-Pyramimonas_sp.AAC.1
MSALDSLRESITSHDRNMAAVTQGINTIESRIATSSDAAAVAALRIHMEQRMVAIESSQSSRSSGSSDVSGPPTSRRRTGTPPSIAGSSTSRSHEDEFNPLKVWVGGFTRPMLKASLEEHGNLL